MNAGLGRHLLLECHDCAAALADGVALEALLRRAADAAGAHVLSAHMHPFGAGLGVTGVLLLRESHISVHTWPEHGYAAVDVFMCGDAEPQRAIAVVIAGLAPRTHRVVEVARGTARDAATASAS